ncbi:pantoate--beta-alanine ligase, partial [Rhizobium johnstonii]|uniref:pantoate--beta-alanine ligase n=1 Tax=Rhizobium johnstonii TaxID=3019933 RepID=UPI003F995803
ALPVRLISVPTVMDSDCLALSSLNVYLSEAERRAAVIVPQTLDEADRLVADGLTYPVELEARLTASLTATTSGFARGSRLRNAV